MHKSITKSLFFVVLLALFFAAVLVNNLIFKGVSLDLTENKVYSLSAGTEEILQDIDEPINLYFFFSDSTSKGMTSLRNYAEQVETLLKKYEEKSGGKINLNIIDPEPFSEAEDRAATFGLTAANLSGGADAVYFGLAGTNSLDDAMIIPFFDPSKEAFLEYDVSKLVYQLNNPELTKLTIISSLPLTGGQNPLTGQMDPVNAAYSQLQQLFDTQLMTPDQSAIPEKTEVLMLWHPQSVSEDLLYAIDQYLMQGGKAIMMLDPHYESDPMAMMGGMGPNASSLPLLSTYGIDINIDDVVLDAKLGLEVRSGQGSIVRHLGYLGLGTGQINRSDITTADLDTINIASAASIGITNDSDLMVQPLLSSSDNTSTMPADDYAMQQDPASLQDNLVLDNQTQTLAARIKGNASSFFANKAQAENPEFIRSTNSLNIVLIADADVLADRFWVQQSNFFGQTMLTPFANNADLIVNLIENYGGSEGLIGIRSRGTFARPFEKVQDLAVEAESKFREQEQLLTQQLEETEAQLAQLQTQQSDSLTLSDEQQAAIDAFVEQRIEIRKSLRDVQFQLDKDIDALGNMLAIINIAVAPAGLVIMLFLIALLMRRKAML